MGGGKTHLLVGFGLLAKHPGLRKTLHVLLRDRETLPVDADDQRALQLERIAGWGLHPLESAALSRRTPLTDLAGTMGDRPSWVESCNFCGRNVQSRPLYEKQTFHS